MQNSHIPYPIRLFLVLQLGVHGVYMKHCLDCFQDLSIFDLLLLQICIFVSIQVSQGGLKLLRVVQKL